MQNGKITGHATIGPIRDIIMATIDIDEAKAHLPELISGLNPGEQLLIVDSGEPLATLTRTAPKQWPCKAGSARDIKHWMAPDFNAPLDEFRDFMQ
jgi:antitoxin (DNA-binding transcriptional repressor) of toxin-antitoxin stability system